MPNWVTCRLQITGAPDVVADCLASMGSPESERESAQLFDFDRVVPLPHELRERMNALRLTWEEAMDMYGELVGLWGTKWSACNVAIERQPDGGGALVKFDTAWNPPTPVICALVDGFTSLEFDFVYINEDGARAGRARHTRDGRWATIEAESDDGFCRAVVEAGSGPWDPRSGHWDPRDGPWDRREEAQRGTPEVSPAGP